jgi:hypothetical protein
VVVALCWAREVATSNDGNLVSAKIMLQKLGEWRKAYTVEK